MRLASIRLWASIGILVIAAGMPYCAAALGWAATQDENTITVRADIAAGVLASWIGCAILAITGAFWIWRSLRSRREAVRA
jgi:putative Mn2+ efflux pump MntP